MHGKTPDRSALQPPRRIGIDVGGSFTDLGLADSTGTSLVVKVPSVAAAPFDADAARRSFESSRLSDGARGGIEILPPT